jgi:hypothetical protein
MDNNKSSRIHSKKYNSNDCYLRSASSFFQVATVRFALILTEQILLEKILVKYPTVSIAVVHACFIVVKNSQNKV